jgi:hypothetical protein
METKLEVLIYFGKKLGRGLNYFLVQRVRTEKVVSLCIVSEIWQLDSGI